MSSEWSGSSTGSSSFTANSSIFDPEKRVRWGREIVYNMPIPQSFQIDEDQLHGQDIAAQNRQVKYAI